MFSIIIPTYNNINYLKICLDSLKKNSKFNHEIILHVNEGVDGSLDYVKKNNFLFSYSEKNAGVCVAFNQAVKKATKKYIVLGHDDMYFCPNWDEVFYSELKKQAEDKDLCNLNVIGKMLYQGNYFDKNVEAAENLFYFLSNKDYPEAQFNFSLLASKNLSHNPQDIINLLLGIYAKYISDSEYSHLSTKAKLLLEGYVGNLKNTITDCAQVKMKGNTCHPAFSKLTHAGAQELYLSANNALIKTNMNFYKTMAIGTQRQKEKWDTIMTIVSIGALAYSLSAPSYSSPGTSYAPSDPCGGFLTAGCGFEWNPMNLPQIQ